MEVIRGKVRRGASRGKKLGYPTANLALHKKIEQGIYVSITKIDGKNYNSVTFLGNATTFNEKKVFVETHIFKFDKNIYNKWIAISLIKKIRDNKKFNNARGLKEQMKKHIEIAEKYFKENV